MDWRYDIHPGIMALGETEQYYVHMASKGWKLVKRGSIFSRFARMEPRDLDCHIEVVGAETGEQLGLTQEQITFFQEHGWELAAYRDKFHVFLAPAGTEVPEFTLEPEQRARTVRQLRTANWCTLGALALLVLLAAMIPTFFNNGHSWRWAAQVFLGLIEETGLFLSAALFLVLILIQAFMELGCTCRIGRQIRKELPLTRRSRWRGSRIGQIVTYVVTLWALFNSVASIITDAPKPMPVQPQQEYLQLSELGVSGERGENMLGEPSSVGVQDSILARHWDCREFVEDAYLYQEVYQLKLPVLVDPLIKALMLDATFAQSEEDFAPMDIPGLDGAWITPRLECIAQKGNRVAVLTHSFNTREEMVQALEKLGEKWS